VRPVITRTAEVYRLWVDTDLTDLFTSLALKGWSCQIACGLDGSDVKWVVGLSLPAERRMVSASRTDVVISDGVTVETMTVAAFNADHPDELIEEGS